MRIALCLGGGDFLRPRARHKSGLCSTFADVRARLATDCHRFLKPMLSQMEQGAESV